MNYTVMNYELPKLKAALTRAKNSGDPKKVLDAVSHAFDRFNYFGWPDNWHTWNIAMHDAYSEYVRSEAYRTDDYLTKQKYRLLYEACR